MRWRCTGGAPLDRAAGGGDGGRWKRPCWRRLSTVRTQLSRRFHATSVTVPSVASLTRGRRSTSATAARTRGVGGPLDDADVCCWSLSI
jgi:hypothetical protein